MTQVIDQTDLAIGAENIAGLEALLAVEPASVIASATDCEDGTGGGGR